MPKQPILFWLGLLIFCGLLTAPASVSARPPRSRHAHRTPHTVSVQEAEAASAKKVMLRKKLLTIHQHIRRLRAKIHETRVQEHHIKESIGTVEDRLHRTRGRLTRVNARLSALAAERDAKESELQAAQMRLAVRRRLLAQRLAANYRRSETTYASVLIRSRSVHDLLSRGYYVRRIVDSDAALIQGVKRDLATIAADKRALEAQAREQEALAAEYEAQKSQYLGDVKEKQELLRDKQADEAEVQDELDTDEAESNEMGNRIRALAEMLRRRQDQEAAMRRAWRRSHRPAGGGHEREEPEPPTVWRGGFIRPCDGRRTSGFGARFHPILHRMRMHTGVDFGAPTGTPIRAAAGGTVIMAQFSHGYGNCVVIDHGNGVSTLYGHASAILVSEGEAVRQGQVIARVGATGMATGPHLHFEVRHNGVPVAPPF